MIDIYNSTDARLAGILYSLGEFKENRIELNLDTKLGWVVKEYLDKLEIRYSLRGYDKVMCITIIDSKCIEHLQDLGFDNTDRKNRYPRMLGYLPLHARRSFINSFIQYGTEELDANGNFCFSTLTPNEWVQVLPEHSEFTDGKVYRSP